MPLSISAIAKCILLVLFVHHAEGSQNTITVMEVSDDDLVNDKIYTRSRATDDDSGTDILSDLCCIHGNCSCLFLHTVLTNLTNNTLVNVTSNVTLASVIPLVDLVNITIFGHNNPTVYCNDYGGVHFVSCYNCTIEGITWQGCGGRNISDNTAIIHPVLQLHNSSNVVVKNCSFQNSIGQALVLTGVSQDVNINHCNFLYNEQYRGHGTAIHYSTNIPYQDALGITIANCKFSNNSAMSVVYLGPTFIQNLDCYLYNSSFYFNKASPIYLSKQKFEVRGYNEFYGNTAENGGAIFITDYSKLIFHKSTIVKFMYNTANNYGGAIYLTDHSSILFKEYPPSFYEADLISNKITLMFHHNQANKCGKDICTYQGYITFGTDAKVTFSGDGDYSRGTALCVEHRSIVKFDGNSEVTFYNSKYSYGGAMYIVGQSDVVFQGNTTVILNNNAAIYDGGAIYIYSSYVTFKQNCEVTFINNKASNGGAAYIADKSTVTFEGNSTIKTRNNFATNRGTLYISAYSTVVFEANSEAIFSNNKVHNGGALYITSSFVALRGNCSVAFDSNEAYNDGGAVCIVEHSTLTFAGNSKVSFNNNSAGNGGAVYSYLSCVNTEEVVKFIENSTIVFKNNKGNDKGGAVCIDGTDPTISHKYCYPIKFDNMSEVTFTNNEAFNGGAVYIGYNINIISKGDTAIAFNSNKAHIGGAIYSYASNITFQGESTARFNCNVALQNGGALFSYRHCNISFQENSTATFTHNEAAQGGVMHIQFNSAIKFQGNCTIAFIENKAIENGGVIHCSINSLIAFNDYTNILFQGNTAKTGGAINLYNAVITNGLKSNITFENNMAELGGAIYIALSNITFTGNTSSIQFIKNAATQDGGAVYLSDHSNFLLTNNTKVNFSDNFASDDGESIYIQLNNSLLTFNSTEVYFHENDLRIITKPVYINVPKSCNRSCLVQRVTKIHKNLSLPIVTSPRKLILYNPVKCIYNHNSECSSYYISNIMLGQEIRFNACVWDYYDQPTELTQFLVTGMNHQPYNMSGSKYISVLCDHATQGISINGNLNTVFNYSIHISMYAAKTSGSKIISVNLTVELSQCHPGFHYSSESRKCECYNTKNFISCSGSSSTIRRGYWFGSVNGKSTVASCPNDYCNFTCCEISNGIYHLSPVRANQCAGQRSGTACGNCEKGYTLSFDSPQCIEINNCTIGQTVLVTVLSLLYWITVIVTVFVMMYFKVAIGSLYAIMYYYSVVDILLRQQASFISNGLYTTINIMSSLAKLTPQFLGQLCLVRNMSGIDQQFIHYIHPIVISLILVMISALARKSHSISSFISRGIIPFICFLLLLSYTSVTTTSLLLMRSLTFEGIGNIYTYLSPDVEYFHGRHFAYVIMAITFTIAVVIGLPLLLLLEPFLNSKINFVKIKPLLDQFQGVYKDKYRYFAAYYMICRIVIITLVIIRGSDDLTIQYVLISVCTLMALIHLIVRPYVDKVHNIFDGIILQLIVIISVLPVIEFTGSYNKTLVVVIVYAFVILPITSFLTIKLWLNKNGIQDTIKSVIIKYKHKYSAIPTDDDVEIAPINEITVDNSVRRNVTVVDM